MVELPGTAPGSNPLILTYVYCRSYRSNISNIGQFSAFVKGENVSSPVNVTY